MSKFVIAVFPDEMRARQGVAVLGDLHREANATFYGTAVVRLEPDEGLVVLQPTDQGSIPLGVGALVKGLVELFQPMAPTGERWRDYLRSEISDDSLAALERALRPCNFAVLTEVAEEWAAPIGIRMTALGGIVMRLRRENGSADVIRAETVALTADVGQWKAERATMKARAMERNLAKRIDEARAKLLRNAEIARLRQDRTQEELGAELTALQEQAALATPDTRSLIEQRLEELRHDLVERAEKLTRAYELTQAALHA